MTGFKTFADGDPLSAAEVNGYLMTQAVMTFADASARDTALPSPSEGMTVFVADTNQLQMYDGSSWVTIADLDTWSFIGDNPEIANSSPKLTINDTDATVGGTVGAYVDLEANGTRAGYIGFPNSSRLYVRTENGDMYVQADNGSILMIPEGAVALKAYDADKERFYQDGTAAAPVITWHSDQDTGIYRAGSNLLGIVTGGAERISVANSAVFLPTPGTTTSTTTWRVGTFNAVQTPSSSAALKENISDLTGDDAIAILEKLQPRTFTWKPQPGDSDYLAELKQAAPQAGFIVEEVAAADLPFLMVEHRPTITDDMTDEQKVAAIEDLASYEPYYWKEPHLIAILTAAVKNLSARVAQLEAGKP